MGDKTKRTSTFGANVKRMTEVSDPAPPEMNGDFQTPPETTPRMNNPRVRLVLIAQFALFVFCAGIYQLIAMLAGWDQAPMLTPAATEAERWMTRIQLGLGHVLSFGVAAFLTVWLFYRNISRQGPDWRDYLGVRRAPGLPLTGLTVLLMAVSLPLVLFLLNINQLIPLPETLKLAEKQTEDAIKGLLQMNHAGEFVANLFIIALLPAMGEELMFRGVVQQQLMRRIANPWLALLISAAVFSFVHFQFEGFLPRMLLGLILGWLYWRTHNFWVPVTAHFFNNALQVTGQYLYGKEISSVDLEQDIQVPWFAAALSAFLVWVTIRQINQLK